MKNDTIYPDRDDGRDLAHGKQSLLAPAGLRNMNEGRNAPNMQLKMMTDKTEAECEIALFARRSTARHLAA